ncbi:Antilisterial bacteriocin subtilosin biosynthesis protein AlbA [Thalassovita gelatinovora]|uniref:Antilisterial bacteriocin subtilosin biosynthesis protein AlbA n=1 Tax=Thalassovita gelatinovora TaxID=53501 RepID=A0A0N7LU74_THAGE|nr:radical SAM protein [Thalassovita gelatinovora]QIZ79387.1 radical SAM protein [Thalassovita gelatinovora]CUH62706.1 Antilisterial bacteriocin subtilosin biosynthesis protein AlbA [Thalassovita gelatinovora]SEQ08816.1 4Fe-4S single cluster domain-containing protein [Thalassovita gelatinovora]
MKDSSKITANIGKFSDPAVTADGQVRATVALSRPETLWFNTGTLCNIACVNCYIESSPSNDSLVYISTAEVEDYLDQLEDRGWNVREIGFTGGEPFLNPDMIEMLRAALQRGYDVLVLTNAMLPMMRPAMRRGLQELNVAFPGRMTLRVSLDHWDRDRHDQERGAGSFDKSLKGMDFLRDAGIPMAVAGRALWHESDAAARDGYRRLFAERSYPIDATHPGQCVLFPEMDASAEVPEITTACWGILDTSPEAVMCSSSRMVVKRKGAEKPAVLACTLLAYDPQFELGTTLAEAERDVALNHPHCAKFCVLGGASCSA